MRLFVLFCIVQILVQFHFVAPTALKFIFEISSLERVSHDFLLEKIVFIKLKQGRTEEQLCRVCVPRKKKKKKLRFSLKVLL